MLFKLFEILDMEFMAGNVCKDCTHLIQQLDGLKYQYECLKENLQNRVDKFFDKDINYKACLDTQVWPLTQFFPFPFRKKSLICLEGKSMTPHRGNTILFCSSQQLPRLRLGPSKGFLS